MKIRLILLAVIALTAAAHGVPAQPRTLVLSHVNLVDVAAGSIRRDMTVTIADGRITAIGGSAKPAKGAQVVDGTGKYVIPGLWDMHVHWYDERFLPLFIANGVTGARQMFGAPVHLSWKQRLEDGSLLGPRQVLAGPIVDGPNPVWPRSIVAADAQGGREAVQQTKRDGYDFIKVYNRLPREAYLGIVEEAKRTGLPVEGHVPNAVSAAEASDAGQKTIEHLTGVLIAASSAEAEARRGTGQILATAPRGGGLDPAGRAALRLQRERTLATYDDVKAAALFARFRANGTWHCPTLTVLRSGAFLNDPAFVSDSRLKYMPATVRESWKPENSPLRGWKTNEDYDLDRRTLQLQLRVVGAMQKAGVPLLAGTDVLNPFAFPGFSLHDELKLLTDAGLTPAQALQAATMNPARYLGKTALQGTVETGKIADLVLLDGNPLDDITMTKKIAAVVFRGQLFDRQALDGILRDAEQMAAR